MGFGDSISKKLYMRELSNDIHKWSPKTVSGILFIAEDPTISLNAGLARQIIILLCRNKQRILKQAWQYWTKNANVLHDYSLDVRVILSRNISPYTKRSELEIEVLYKWCQQKAPFDSTSICHAVVTCKKKVAIICVLQHMRIEFFRQKDALLYQSARPKPEDGQFTILSGELDVLQLQEGSVTLLRLQYFCKKKQFNSCKVILKKAQVLGSLKSPAGFGELSTLTDTARSASLTVKSPTAEIVITPKHAVMYCIENKRTMGDDGKEHNEQELGIVMDFLVQAGLANRISPADLYLAAINMTKRVMTKGEILFIKGEPVVDLYLVVSGDFLLDLSDNIVNGAYVPFSQTTPNMCFCLGTHSILGDEGLTGIERVFESTAVVASTAAFVYTVSGFAKQYIKQRLQASRYAALTYKDLPKLTPPIQLAESINIYSQLNSLRKAYASSYPFRGSLEEYITNKRINHSYNIAHSKSKALTGDLSTKDDDTAMYEDVYESSALSNGPADKSNIMGRKGGTRADIGLDQGSVISSTKFEPLHVDIGYDDKIKVVTSKFDGKSIRVVTGGTLTTVMLIYKSVKNREKSQISSSAQDNIIADHVQEINRKIAIGKITKEILAKSDSKLRLKIDEYNEETEERLRRLQISLKVETETDFAKAAEARSLFASMASAGIAGTDEEDNTTANNEKGDADDNAEGLSEDDKEVLRMTKMAQFYRHIDLTGRPADEDIDFHKVKNKFHLKKKSMKKGVYNVSYATVPPTHPVKTPAELHIPWRPSSRPASPVDPLLLVETATNAKKSINSSSRAISRLTNPQQYLDKTALQRHNEAYASNEQKETDDINDSFKQMGEDTGADLPAATPAAGQRRKVAATKGDDDKFFRPPPPTNIRSVLSVKAFDALINPSNSFGLNSSGNNKYARSQKCDGIADLSWMVRETVTMQDPDDFLDFLKRKDFDKKKEYRADSSWQTRFMKVQNERPVLLPAGMKGGADGKQGLSKSLSFAIRKKLMSLTDDDPGTTFINSNVDVMDATRPLVAADSSPFHKDDIPTNRPHDSTRDDISMHSSSSADGVHNHKKDVDDNQHTGNHHLDSNNHHHHHQVDSTHSTAVSDTSAMNHNHNHPIDTPFFSPIGKGAIADLTADGVNNTFAAVSAAAARGKSSQKMTLASSLSSDIFATVESGKLKDVNPPSSSIDKFNIMISAEPVSRKYLDGKRSAGFGSKFQLQKDLSLLIERTPPIASTGGALKLSAAERREYALISSIVPSVLSADPATYMTYSGSDSAIVKRSLEHITQKVLPNNVKKFFEKRRSEDSEVVDRMSNIILDSMSFTTDARSNIKRKELLMYSDDDHQSVSSNRSKILAKSSLFNGIDEKNADNDDTEGGHSDNIKSDAEFDPLVDWQKFSCERTAKTNVGPKRTLPVLLDGGKSGGVKSSSVSKFGRNLAYIPAASELDALIEPPSYLEVFSNRSIRAVRARSDGGNKKG